MSRWEKNLLIGIILGGALVGSFWLTGRSLAKARVLESMNGRLIFSSASYANPGGPPARLLVDGLIETAVPDLNAAGRRSISAPVTQATPESRLRDTARDWVWSPERAFVQLQVGLTHSPARPPRPNPLIAMRVWSGDQTDYYSSARPKTLRLVFFHQQLVDLDREYRLPEEPIFWQERTVRLADRQVAQRVDLGFLEDPPESPGFPREVQQIWLRIEILDFYPGQDPKRSDSIALSELAFEFRDPVRSPANTKQ